jgi:hypothetical protein
MPLALGHVSDAERGLHTHYYEPYLHKTSREFRRDDSLHVARRVQNSYCNISGNVTQCSRF